MKIKTETVFWECLNQFIVIFSWRINGEVEMLKTDFGLN